MAVTNNLTTNMNIKNLSNLNKCYLINSGLFLGILLSVYLMFYVQYKVGMLQEKVDQANESIVAYEDEIRILEVEWVYLTRPERLRVLAERYLQKNDYIASDQVKEVAQLEKYYLANLEKVESKQLAMRQTTSSDSVNEEIAVKTPSAFEKTTFEKKLASN
jgi:cell division protein FtsL